MSFWIQKGSTQLLEKIIHSSVTISLVFNMELGEIRCKWRSGKKRSGENGKEQKEDTEGKNCFAHISGWSRLRGAQLKEKKYANWVQS